jgi:hypothetical protein
VSLDLHNSSAAIPDRWGVRSKPFVAVLPSARADYLDLRIVRDGSTLEIFADGGLAVFSAVVPEPDASGPVIGLTDRSACSVDVQVADLLSWTGAQIR